MRNNFESDIKYMPYKEFVKKKGIRLLLSEKNKNEYKSLSPEQKKRGDERILNSGLIDNHQKNKQN